MIELIIFGLICYSIGFVTAIATVLTIIKKAMGMMKRPKPPKT